VAKTEKQSIKPKTYFIHSVIVSAQVRYNSGICYVCHWSNVC